MVKLDIALLKNGFKSLCKIKYRYLCRGERGLSVRFGVFAENVNVTGLDGIYDLKRLRWVVVNTLVGS